MYDDHSSSQMLHTRLTKGIFKTRGPKDRKLPSEGAGGGGGLFGGS